MKITDPILKIVRILGDFFVRTPARSVSGTTHCLVAGLLLAACFGCDRSMDDSTSVEEARIVVTDDTGYRVELQKAPARVVSIAPNVTEIMFAIGADERLVGVTDICDFPPEAKEKPKIGDFVNPDLEKIVACAPDLVIGSGTFHPVLGRLRDLGVPVLSFNPTTIDELLVMIERLGAVMGREAAARDLTMSLRAEIETVGSSLPRTDRVKVFVEIWYDPLMTAGAGSFVNDLVETAGGDNIAASVGSHYFEISQEHVLDANPDVILAAYMEKDVPAREMILNRETWRTVSGVASGRVYDDVDPDLLLRPSVRAVHTVKELAARFYPERFGKETK